MTAMKGEHSRPSAAIAVFFHMEQLPVSLHVFGMWHVCGTELAAPPAAGSVPQTAALDPAANTDPLFFVSGLQVGWPQV